MASSIKIVVNTAKQETNQTVEVLQGSGDAGQPTMPRQMQTPPQRNTQPWV